MRLVTYGAVGAVSRVGVLIEDRSESGQPLVVDLAALAGWVARRRRGASNAAHVAEMRGDLRSLLRWRPDALDRVRETLGLVDEISDEDLLGSGIARTLVETRLRSPISDPPSVRDFYAFEQHVRQARARRGLEMVPEWYEFPVFYFSSTANILGPDDPVRYPHPTRALDYELEVAAIIGRECRDVAAEHAEEVIAGYTILNDWSARDLQRAEMRVGLGPAKGKDFATSLGPYLVTPEDLADRRLAAGRYDLSMVARVNGVERSRGNWRDIHWTFAQMIERASQNAWLRPGDVIGSGTVGTGCLLELGGDDVGWLQPGDTVELEIERLGVLRNTVVDRAINAAHVEPEV